MTDMFAGSFKLLAMPSAYVHVSDASVWSPDHFGSPMCGFEPLAGKFGIADAFSGLFELSPTPCACMRAICVPVWLSSLSIYMPL